MCPALHFEKVIQRLESLQAGYFLLSPARNPTFEHIPPEGTGRLQRESGPLRRRGFLRGRNTPERMLCCLGTGRKSAPKLTTAMAKGTIRNQLSFRQTAR